MSKQLLVRGSSTYCVRHELAGLGGRWNRDLQAWLFPVSRRGRVARLLRQTDADIDLYDARTGKVTYLPRTAVVNGRTFTYLPPSYHAQQRSHGSGA